MTNSMARRPVRVAWLKLRAMQTLFVGAVFFTVTYVLVRLGWIGG